MTVCDLTSTAPSSTSAVGARPRGRRGGLGRPAPSHPGSPPARRPPRRCLMPPDHGQRNGAGARNGNGNGYKAVRRRRKEREKRRRTRRKALVVLCVASSWAGRPRWPQPRSRASPRSARAVTSPRWRRSRSARTRSCTRPTARSSVRFRPRQHSQPVSLRKMSPWLGKATVAIEDRRFYDHGGVDYEGIVRAAVENYKAQDVVRAARRSRSSSFGTSTGRSEPSRRSSARSRSLPRAEARRRVDEGQDPESYMNQVYYGKPCLRGGAASQTYFSKRAVDLTLAEAAMIAGLPQAPS